MWIGSKYFGRQAVIYYALVFPSLVLEVIFSAIIISNADQIAPRISSLEGVIAPLVELIPFVMLALSLYAIAKFRPSMLAAFLAISFFIYVIAGSLGPSVLIASTALVIITMFLSMIGFNHGRSVKLLSGKQARIESSGPIQPQVLSSILDIFFPFLAALIMVLAASGAVDLISAQAKSLPDPLSTLTTLYLNSQLGLVFTSILVAGVIIWSTRQLLEPVILYYTITRSDALSMALREIDDIVKNSRETANSKPASGKVWIAAAIICVIVIFALSTALEGWNGDLNDVASMLQLHPAVRTFVDSNIASRASLLVERIDSGYAFLENLLRTIVRILWG